MRHEAVQMVSKPTTIMAPIKGINAYDPLVGMPDGFALVLRNLYAQPYGCQVRRGSVVHAEVDGRVESLMSHNVTDAKLYAVTDDGFMWDVTTPNGVPIEKVNGLSNARWQHINFANAAGVHLIACNGADPLIWVQPNGAVVRIAAGDGSNNTIAGVDPATFNHVTAHQKRMWFVQKNTTRGWYLPPDQIYGTAKYFDFGPLMTMGGSLAQIITWTIDDGEGADDHLAAITTEGQVLVYKGTDPDFADTWALQGVYYAGAPIGGRPATRYGGDVFIVTVGGIVIMSELLKSTKVNAAEGSPGRYIQQLISRAASLVGNRFGWQPFIFPGENMVMLNIPVNDSNSFQFTMNNVTKAWSEFIGYLAWCWELHDQLPFYGADGAIYRAWEGYTDDATVDVNGKVTKGTPIRSEAQTAFSYFGVPGFQKHYKMVRPTIMSQGRFTLAVTCNTDFVFDSTPKPVPYQFQDFGLWDEGIWDEAIWSGGLSTYKQWIAVTGIGTAASLRILLTTDAETYWPSTDWLFEPGGVM